MSVTSLNGTTWILNDSLTYSPFTYASQYYKLTRIKASFTSNGNNYTQMQVIVNNVVNVNVQYGSNMAVYYQDKWEDANGNPTTEYKTITFTGSVSGNQDYDATEDEAIAWLEANATLVKDEVEISYKGSVIASMNASGTKTLETAGMYCEGDIEVEYTKSGGTIIEDGNGDIELGKTGDVALITPLSVTENDTYTAPANTGYSPVNVNVSGGGGTTCNLTISVEVIPGPPVPSMGSAVKYIDTNGTLQTITINTGTSSSETVTVPCPCIIGFGGEAGSPFDISGDAYMAIYQYGFGAIYVYGDATIQFSA